jgi:hypothetical protein
MSMGFTRQKMRKPKQTTRVSAWKVCSLETDMAEVEKKSHNFKFLYNKVDVSNCLIKKKDKIQDAVL